MNKVKAVWKRAKEKAMNNLITHVSRTVGAWLRRATNLIPSVRRARAERLQACLADLLETVKPSEKKKKAPVKKKKAGKGKEITRKRSKKPAKRGSK